MKSVYVRILLFLLCSFGLSMNGFVFANSSDFTNHWASTQLQEWLDKGILKGYTDGSVKPDDPITRAEFTALANKVFGFTHEAGITYSDVPYHSWYQHEISKGTAAGYIKGYENGTFKPNQPITREEAAVMLDRMLQLESENIPDDPIHYADRDSISKWSMGAVKRMAATGYMKGYAGGTFRPNKRISRAEAVVMLSRASGELIHQAGTYGSENSEKVFAGNVTVTTGKVHLANAIIKGDLLLAEAVGEDDVTLNNVIVEGKTRIAGGGTQSIYITGTSAMNEVLVGKKTGSVRIVLRDHVQIQRMRLLTDAHIVNETEKPVIYGLYIHNKTELKGNFEEINVDSPETILRIRDGNVGKLTVAKAAGKSEIFIDNHTTIDRLILDSSTNIYGKGKIELAEISATGVMIESNPQKIRIIDGMRAMIAGKEYPPATVKEDKSGNRSSSGGNGGGNSKIPVTGIRLSQPDLSMKLGETANLIATVTPANATNKIVTWKSSNKSVATVSEGVVTAKSVGTATITVTTADGGFTATSLVTVAASGTKPSIASAEITPENELIISFSVITNQSGELSDRAAVDAVIDWGGKSPGAKYKGSWSVVNGKSVLTISIMDATGRNLADGDTISIKSSANVRDERNTSDATDASAVVRGSWEGGSQVIPVTGIIIDAPVLSMKPGEVANLTATVIPANATNKNIAWKSSDESVAVVTEGVVTAKSVGTATVTVTTVDGGFTATSLVTVAVPGTKPSIASAEITPENELIITFSAVTNQSGELVDRAVVDAVIDWGGKSPGANYKGSWSVVNGKSVLTITILDTTGRNLVAGDTISIKSSANVRDESNTSDATDASAIVRGSWGGGSQIIPVAGIRLDPPILSMKPGETASLFATVLPANATNKKVIWRSNDDSVATVTEGIINTRAVGTAMITVTTADGGFTAASQIHVRNGGADVEVPALDIPVIRQSPFTLEIRNAQDDSEIKLEGNKRVTVTAAQGEQSTELFNDTVMFNQGGSASVNKLKVPDTGSYDLTVAIEGISDPIVIRNVQVVSVMEAVLRAQTADELHRALAILGILHAGEFDANTVVLENMQAYIDDFAINQPQAASEVQERVNEVNDRTIAPQFAAGYPELDELSDTSFDFKLKLNKIGTVYYMVVEDRATPPTPEEVKTGQPYGDVVPVATGSKVLALGSYGWGMVSGVTANTKYNIYLVAESARGALSKQTVLLEVTTQPPVPAAFIDGYPMIDALKDIQFNLKFQATKAGKAYYIIVLRDANAPTSGQVKAGVSYGGVSIKAKGFRDVPLRVISFGTITGLSPSTAYDVYAVMEDQATGSLQQEPTKLQVTTLSEQAPAVTQLYPVLDSVTDQSFTFGLWLNKQGKVYYMLVKDGATAPTSQEVKSGQSYRDVVPVKTGYVDVPDSGFGAFGFYDLSDLAANTKYVLYISTESTSGVLSEQPASTEVTTKPAEPARFIDGNPSARHAEEDRFILALNLTKAGTVHYVVVPKDSNAPTREEVKAGNEYQGITPVAKGSVDANPNADVLVTGLSPGTEYDIYAVIEGTLSGLQPPVKIQAATIPDSAPVYWDGPKVFDIADTEFKLQMGITKPGYGYYLVQQAGKAPPTSEQVKANPTGTFDLRPVGSLWQYIRNLTPETAYDIYAVAETVYGTLQAEPIKLQVTTSVQTDPPEFILGTPTIRYTGKDRIDFDYKLNKAGTVHYLFVGPDAQAPTAEQVVAGISYGGVSIIRSGQVDFILDGSIPFLYIEGLTPGTTYAIYIVGKGAGGKMTPVVRLEATTRQ